MNVVAYVRISSQSQIDNTSIEMQKEKINLHCKLHDLNLIKVFKDEGRSAKNLQREQYNQMIDFISDKENKIDLVIVYKSDRIHRSLKNLLIFIEDILKPSGVGFLSITEQFDTSTPQGMLFLQMLGSFSEFERKLINERTKSGRIKKGDDKMYIGGRPPFGYKLIKDHLVPSQEEAIIVKEMFKLRNKNYSYNKIAAIYCMSKQRIRYILNNEIYIGNYTYNGEKEKNNIVIKVEPIITKYVFYKNKKV